MVIKRAIRPKPIFIYGFDSAVRCYQIGGFWISSFVYTNEQQTGRRPETLICP